MRRAPREEAAVVGTHSDTRGRAQAAQARTRMTREALANCRRNRRESHRRFSGETRDGAHSTERKHAQPDGSTRHAFDVRSALAHSFALCRVVTGTANASRRLTLDGALRRSLDSTSTLPTAPSSLRAQRQQHTLSRPRNVGAQGDHCAVSSGLGLWQPQLRVLAHHQRWSRLGASMTPRTC